MARERRWDDAEAQAERLMQAGLSRAVVSTSWARGALLGGAAARALRILGTLSRVEQTRFTAQLRVQSLMELKQTKLAQRIGEMHLVTDPDDLVMRRLVARVRPARDEFLAVEPLQSLARAKRHVRNQEFDEALRILRLLAYDNPDVAKLQTAIRNVEHRKKVAQTVAPSNQDPA